MSVMDNEGRIVEKWLYAMNDVVLKRQAAEPTNDLSRAYWII